MSDPTGTASQAERPDRRLTRAKRLRRGADFRHVFHRPARSSDACFSVSARRRAASDPASTGPARLGLAVSRKALSRAVDRNRIKRLVRETFRQTGLCDGIDFVVVARAGLREADNAAVRSSIRAHLRGLRRRLCPHPELDRNGD